MNRIEVKEINMNEIEQGATTLFYAFKNDPLMQWIFESEQAYDVGGIPMFKTWVKYCILYGKAFRTNNFESVALRKKPGDVKLTFWHMLRSGMLRTPRILGKDAFNRLIQFDQLSTNEQKKNMREQLFWYCWVLGTKSPYQNQGFGSALMEHTFNMAKKDKLPCYLETASDASKQIHIGKGFRVLSEIILPGSNIKITSMIKEFI